MTDLIPLKTKVFFVINEQTNADMYNAVIAERYLKWVVLWKDLIK